MAKAERQIAEARVCVERQLQIVVELERDGRDTAQAMALLNTFEQTYASHVMDRDRLRKELRPWGLPPEVLG
jgi:hypothetical protein